MTDLQKFRDLMSRFGVTMREEVKANGTTTITLGGGRPMPSAQSEWTFNEEGVFLYKCHEC